jgi:hypothetical protein
LVFLERSHGGGTISASANGTEEHSTYGLVCLLYYGTKRIS